MTAIQQALAADMLDLAYGLAWRLSSRRLRLHWWPEIRGAAALGLCRAVKSFDPSAGRQLGSWVWLRVRGAVVDEMRAIERCERWNNAVRALPPVVPTRRSDWIQFQRSEGQQAL